MEELKSYVCENCGEPLDLRMATNGFVQCKCCGRVFKIQHNDAAEIAALNDVISRRVIDKDFFGALECCERQIKANPSNLAFYWQALLAEYGIIYVKDDDGVSKPTFFNIEYDTAHKDRISKSKYFKELERRAAFINEDITDYRNSVKELDGVLNKLSDLVVEQKPYDIFISFKTSETLELANGETYEKETTDKKKAEELYKFLTGKGYKVFFSPVDIGVKANGKVYEPIILRALQTANVMLLFGSKEQYINATWVENEWRRYRYYIQIGKKQSDSILLLYNEEKPKLPPALRRADVGNLQIKHISYSLVSYLEEVEDAIKPFVHSRDIGTTKIERKKVEKTKRVVSRQELSSFNRGSEVDLNLSRMLNFNVAADLAKPESRKRAVNSIRELKAKYPNSGHVLAYDLTISLGGSSLNDLPTLLPKEEDWKKVVSTVTEIIKKADDEAFYKRFLGLMYDTVFNTVKSKRSVLLFNVIKNCRYEDKGRDLRTSNLKKLKVQAKSVLNGMLFKAVIDCLELADDDYRDELTEFAAKTLEARRFEDAYKLAQSILKLDNGLIEVIDIRNLAKRKATNWGEVFNGGHCYNDQTLYQNFEEALGFTSTDDQVDKYLNKVKDIVINNLNISVQNDYNQFVDKFLGLYRDSAQRRKIMEAVTDLALSRECFDTCLHYCQYLLTNDNDSYNARIYWKMTLCNFKCKDKSGLMLLREDLDTCSYFTNAQNYADDKFCAELAAIRSEQLAAVQRNLAKDEDEHRKKISRRVGKTVNIITIIAVLCGVGMGLLAFFGFAPLSTSFYRLSFGLFGSGIYFYVLAGVLAILLLFCLSVFKNIKRDRMYKGKVKAKSVFVAIVLAVAMLLPPIAGISAVSNILPKKTYVAENGAVLLLESCDDERNSLSAYDDEYGQGGISSYKISKIMVPNGVTYVTLPDEVDDVKVSTIGSNVFVTNKNNVKCVVFGKNITKVESVAFSGCQALQTVCLSPETTYVESDVFEDCDDVTVFFPNDEVPTGWLFATSDNVNVVMSSEYSGEPIIEGADADFSYYVNEMGAVIFKYTGNKTSVVVPAEIDGYPVVSVENNAFDSTLRSLELPETVTYISSKALAECKFLKKIKADVRLLNDVPKTVEEFEITGSGTFDYQMSRFSNLKSVTLGEGFTWIAANAFYGCDTLERITLGSTVTNIGKNAFSGCTSLGSIELPDKVTGIGERAFYGCSGLTSITLPAGLKAIGENAFGNCSGVTSVYYRGGIASWCEISGLDSIMAGERTLYVGGKEIKGEIEIPESVKNISAYAFYGCKNLTGLKFGSGVTAIGENAFGNCSGLTSVEIPDGVTSIGEHAFHGCVGLTSVEIPDSVTSIGYAAFSGCSSLRSITIPFVGARAGVGSDDTEQYPFGYIFGEASYDGGTATTQYYYGSSTTSTTSATYYIPTALESVQVTGGNIPHGAFYGCRYLTDLTLGSGVTAIGENVFTGCSALTEVNYTGDIVSWCAISGLENLVLNNNITLLFNGAGMPDTINLQGAKTISGYAFYNCSGITEITIPSTVTSIGENAFHGCVGLTSIKIPNSVTSIGSSAFSGCSSLESLTIPFVGKTANGTTNTRIGYIFGEDSNSSYNSAVPAALKTVVVTGGTNIGGYAFANCSGITEITIPDSVTSIGRYAFYGCSSLTSMEIPDGVTSIGSSAFSGCNSLTSATFENTSGWWYSSSGSATSGTSLSSSNLADASCAATYLRSTYNSYYWKRS